jgi:hypothetical protein
MKVTMNQAQKRAAIQQSFVLGGRFLVSCLLLYAATQMTTLLSQQGLLAAALLLVSFLLVGVAGLSMALRGVHLAFAHIASPKANALIEAHQIQQHKVTQP